VAAHAFRQGGASCLLATFPLEMCAQCGLTVSATQPIQYTRTRTGRTRPAPNYIETGDSHNTTSRSSQSHRPIRPISLHSKPNGNCTGKLWVQVYSRVGSSYCQSLLAKKKLFTFPHGFNQNVIFRTPHL